jgi:hypothetical protein
MDLLDPRPDGIEAFMMRETGPQGRAEPVVWPIGTNKDPTDVNTALFHDFTKKRSLTAISLKGCTMLAIIGRKGVYMGHYWENIAFDPDDEHMEQGETPEDTFKRTVLDGLEHGIPETGQLQQESLTDFANELAGNDEHLHAYLIRPRQSARQEQLEEEMIRNGGSVKVDPSTLGYPEQWAKMRAMVTKILPRINDPGRWTEIIYEATDNIKILADTSRGRLLFKYDPEHIMAATRKGKPTHLAMLWSEQRELHRDQWQD